MPKTSIERIQDNVHGLMEFHSRETLVVDLLRTPEIQRLRRIKQLGLVNLIFPGAEHSRFAHSLGASYLSLKFVKQLQKTTQTYLADIFIPDEDAINDLAIATLCHDLGHGPLSHAWEKEIIGNNFNKYKDRWANAYSLNISNLPHDLKWHELITLALLSWEDGQLHKTLENNSKGMSERIKLMLMGKHYIPYLPKLIKSDIDVDRSDYIKRDAFMTGVAYGRYDLDWLISALTFGEHKSELVVGFDKRKALRVVEQFLIARRALYDTVYHHKTVVGAEGMIKLLFTRLKDFIEEKHIENTKNHETVDLIIKLIRGDVLTLENIIKFDDNVIWSMIEEIGAIHPFLEDKTLKDLSHRILTRDLFKL